MSEQQAQPNEAQHWLDMYTSTVERHAREKTELEVQLSEARAWAWSAYYGRMDHRWLAWDNRHGVAETPSWLRNANEPWDQDWWRDPVS